MSSISETAELVIAQLVESCTADDRVAALFLGGSLARGEVDEYSDVDLCVIVRGDAYDDVIAARDTFVRAVGEPLFLEDFGDDHMAFAILAGGTELELHFFRAGDVDAIRPGPHRVLLDKDGILASVTFALPEPDRAAQLEQLREYCVNLIRIEQGGEAQDEPYWKLDDEIATEALDGLRSTFVSLERDALLRAGGLALAFFRERAPRIAQAFDLLYPAELDRLVGGHLERLIDARG